MSDRDNVQSIEQHPDEQFTESDPVPTDRQASTEDVRKETKEINIGEIMEKVQQQVQPESVVRVTKVVAPVVKNPLKLYKGQEKYDWKIQTLDATECVEKLSIKKLPQVLEFNSSQQITFEIVNTRHIKGHIHYILNVRDKNGQREVSRRYTQFMTWRAKLIELWPCIFLASLPNKTLIGVKEEDLIRSRSKYILRFLCNLTHHETIYYSEQVQIFLKQSAQLNLESHFQGLVAPKWVQILQKYKTIFTNQYKISTSEEFMYRKGDVPILLNQYQSYFSGKKFDLMEYQSAVRRLAESKQTYFRAASKLTQTILPEYEDALIRWISGEPLTQQPSGPAERISIKLTQDQTQQKQQSKSVQEGEKKEQQKEPQPKKFGLYSSEAYKSRLEDAAVQVKNFNNSTWQIYDILKYELKEIDSVIGAIEQTKVLQREIDYFKRTIAINKEQVEALNNNKTTLKTFFMEGSKDDKKTKLANDNHSFEEQLQRLNELYHILIVLLEKQLNDYHKNKTEFYVRSISKAFTDQIGLARSLMDFHIYQEQLFAKQRQHRVKLLFGEPPVVLNVEIES